MTVTTQIARPRPLSASAISLILVLMAPIAVTACGGGGGGGGGGTVPGPVSPPPPPPTSGQGLVLPSILEASTQENLSNGVFARIEFNVNATDNSLTPQNFRLEGADAVGFELATIVASTNDPNVFRVTIDFDNTTPFDFEAPTDENGDNVYQFEYVFDYGQTTYRVPVEVTIENVDEDTRVAASVVRLEFEPTGVTKIPDISGDGFPDIVLLENENAFDSGVYILSSETIAFSDGIYNLVNNDELFSDFSSSRSGFERLTIRDAADGQGLDILYSDTFENSFKYYDANTAADWAFLAGNVDPDASANNPISYTRTNVNDLIDAQIIHDVNQDGNNDIFAYGQGNGEISLRFGAAQSGPSDTSRSAAADISFTSDDLRGIQPARQYHVTDFPDIDNDGQRELMLVNELYLADSTNQGSGAIWIVNSTRLAASPTTIDLDDPSEPGVRRISGDLDNQLGASLIEIADENGDPFFLIGFGDFNAVSGGVGLVGISLANIQTLPQQASLTDLLAGGVNYVRGPDPASGITDNQPIGPLGELADLDGDGARDFLSDSSVFIRNADILAGTSVTGDAHVIAFGRSPRIGREGFLGFTRNVFDLSDQGLIGYFQDGGSGEFLLVEISEIERVLGNPDGNIIIDVPTP